MKTVFSNSEIPHLWAHQTQSEARNSGNTLFFEGSTIYSYGYHFPIARIIGDVVLMTTQNYSVTTSAHVTEVRRACSHLKVFNVANVANVRAHYSSYRKIDRIKNFNDYKDRVKALDFKIVRARSNKEWLTLERERLVIEANEYRSFAKIKSKTRAIDLKIDVGKIKALQKKEALKKKKEQVAKLKKSMGEILEWKRGVSNWCPRIDKVFLRVCGGKVETSQGVNFPTSHAALCWRIVKRCVDTKENWKANGHTIKLGHYNVESISKIGTLVAGCHRVEFDEIEYIAKKLELLK